MSRVDLNLRVERPEQLLRERVADTLREAIFRGALAPGRRVTERELGELTGVSRTSLREALRQLQAEALLEPTEGRGLRVAVLTEPVVTQLYDVRAILEPAAVEMFVRNSSEEEFAALMALIDRREERIEARLAWTREFYELLLKGTRNLILQQMFGSIEARVHSLRRVSLRIDGRASDSRREFNEILRLIAERDATGAAEAAKKHVMAAKVAALAAIEEFSADDSR